MTAMTDDHEENVRRVVKAFTVPGKHPGYHYSQQARLAEKWPTLYDALLRLARDYRD